jgi:hypothetical protein
MTVTAIQIGLDPDVVDYDAPAFAQFRGLSRDTLRKANDDNVAGLRAGGYTVDNCLIPTGTAGAAKAARCLHDKRYDAVLIGAGIRLVADNTLLFEAIVNEAHVANPECRFVFNVNAIATPDDIRRWYPNPDTAPAR